LEKYKALVSTIWENYWLTNAGPRSLELEEALRKYLNVDHLLVTSSGTMSLQLAIRALGLKGEIITTPLSFVSTVSSIVWEGCTPVFADIDAETLNVHPQRIEEAITEKTSAILVTHLFGCPCDVKAIQKIADKHNLKIIYDAAHAFGVKIDDQSIFNFGDISIGCLHATKIYHSIEGGLMVSKDISLIKKISYMRNFGFDGPQKFAELGINGKMSEFHAAMGLLNLEYIDRILARQKELSDYYDNKLSGFPARTPMPLASSNHSYYPLIFDQEHFLVYCAEVLNKQGIFPRRYFYPPLSSVLPYIERVPLDTADEVSKRVLCLPVYFDLSIPDIDTICAILNNAQDQYLHHL
jgi:dTDP-4-amino-4,6-dideoxygalactose transaminase